MTDIRSSAKLNLFYEEPDGDRWLPFDRYPRRAVRRIVRGPRKPGGMERYYLNLVDGLRRAGVAFRENDFRHAKAHPEEVVGVIGKGHLLHEPQWRNPIVFGPAVFSHPLDDLEAFRCAPVRKVLVSCEWLRRMYQQNLDLPVEVWPAGVDTYTWKPSPATAKDLDVLIYDKVRWRREEMESALIQPIVAELDRRGLKHLTIRYGGYQEADYRQLLTRCKSMIFMVEHETQGFAYLQALASGVPILAWDAGGYWLDPEFYPDRVRFEGVSAVPYWDARCGVKFAGFSDFEAALDCFLAGVDRDAFRPRDYVLENLGLEQCALEYVRHVEGLAGTL